MPQRYLRVRRIVAVLAATVLVAAVVAVASGVGRPGPGQQVAPAAARCRLDPARLPTPPPGATNYLHTCGSEIYDAQGHLVRITGVSWFGLETANKAPDGLWARNWQTILDQLKALGYNTIRLPFSDDALEPGARPAGINDLLNPDLQGLSSLQVMDRIIAGARQRGLWVLLDRHRPSSAGQAPLWYTSQRSQAQWIAEWQLLARRYRGDDTVIGADLNNEPRGAATWGSGDPATDWRLAAQEAGNAILSVNPYWLIFVEGIERRGTDWYWWGGNLSGVARYPVQLAVPNRVVYSPHDYGPDIYPQGWFSSPAFPDNLPSVWDQHWGYIAEQGIAPVVLGEFGGRSVGSSAEGEWHRALIRYLTEHRIGFISWALNPDSADTGGILEDDWLTADPAKESLYRPGLALPSRPVPASPLTTPGDLQVTYHAATDRPAPASLSFILTLVSHRAVPTSLTGTTIRYWIAGDATTIAVVVDWAAIGTSRVWARVVSAPRGNQAGYLEIGFHDLALSPYGTTGPILVRYHRIDWQPLNPALDFSYSPATTDRPWSRIDLYQDGRLVAGLRPQ